MIIGILLFYLLPFDVNIASVGHSVWRITIGVPFLGNHNGLECSMISSWRERKPMKISFYFEY